MAGVKGFGSFGRSSAFTSGKAVAFLAGSLVDYIFVYPTACVALAGAFSNPKLFALLGFVFLGISGVQSSLVDVPFELY